MSFSHGKQPDRGKNIKEKLNEYDSRRNEAGKELNSLLDNITSNNSLMHQVEDISSHPENIKQTIDSVKGDSSLSDYPELQRLIDSLGSMANSIVELHEQTSEKLFRLAREGAGECVQMADFVYKELGDESVNKYIQAQSFGNVHYAFSEMARNIFSFTVAGTSCISAYNKLDFHNWLERALVERMILLNELVSLQVFNPVDNLDGIANIIHEDIRVFEDLSPKEINKLSPDEYRKMLMRIFKLFTVDTGSLKPKAQKFIENEWFKDINENNIQSIIALLEKRHIEQKFIGIEKTISTRLTARLDDTDSNKRKTEEILRIYGKVKGSDTLNKVVRAIENPENSTITTDEINNAKREDKIIQEKLIAKYDSATNELNARAFLLLAAALMLTIAILAIIAIACSTPGLGPVMVALAVVAIASIVIAYMIKPKIFTGIKKDVSHYMDKMLAQYNQWQTKDEIKDHHKMKSGLNSRESHAMFKNKKTSTDSVNASSSLVKSYDKK